MTTFAWSWTKLRNRTERAVLPVFGSSPSRLIAALLMAGLALWGQTAPPLPHFEKRGQATQLIVDGKPFLILGGELHNTAASSTEYMAPLWPVLHAKMHLNTVLVGIGWDWVEPSEGQYDFHIVDNVLENARRNNLRVVFLWFGSWKNSLSSFAPAWVKADQQRFPRVQIRGGRTVEILSTFSDAARDADAKAFAALMRHIREADRNHTVLMMQVENEVGVLGDSRDRSAAADAAFAQPVPAALAESLRTRKDSLLPELQQVWQAAGSRAAGTWQQIFGDGPKADEIFMAWNYARYIDRVVQAGKKEYAIPMYVNAWLVQPEDKGPGDYPSGGPQDHMHDIWRAVAPNIDLLCPDIYLSDFVGLSARYSRSGYPLFIPESFDGPAGAANAFFAVGQRNAIGYSPFAFEAPQGALGDPPSGSHPHPETLAISIAYDTLAQLAPMILEHQSKGTIAAAMVDRRHPEREIKLGGYSLHVTMVRSVRTPDEVPDLSGYGLILATGPDEFLLAGDRLQVTFTPDGPGAPIAGIARQEAGRFENGKWVVTRMLGGDDSVLRYDIANVAAHGQSGSGIRLYNGERTIQRVKLYRYR